MQRRRRSARSRRVLAGAVCLSGIILSGCRTLATVDVSVAPNGSGTVAVTADLDAEAVSAIGGNVDSAIKTADLKAAGWKVRTKKLNSGGAKVTAVKPFGRTDELPELLAEVGGSGDSGVFTKWNLSVKDGFTATTYDLTGTISLTGSIDQFSDAEVAAALDGFPSGRSPEQMAAALKKDPNAFSLVVNAHMPGDLEKSTGLTIKDAPSPDASARYLVGNGAAHTTNVALSAVRSDRSSVVLGTLGVLCLVAGAALLVFRRLGR